MERHSIYLNGEWVEGPKKISVVNPATGETLAEVAAVDRQMVRKALSDAEVAFPTWSKLPAKARGDFLLAIAHELASRADALARIITLENGKPLAQSKGEVAMTIDHLRWFEEEVVSKANATEYGLAAYAFTRDLNRGLRMAETLQAGTIGLNDAVPATSNCPFGGFKQSGWGRELGTEGLDAYLETKHVSIGGRF